MSIPDSRVYYVLAIPIDVDIYLFAIRFQFENPILDVLSEELTQGSQDKVLFEIGYEK